MVKITTGFAVFLLACLPILAVAESGPVVEDQGAIRATLKAAVDNGLTIDEAVAQEIKVTPQHANEITQTALHILKRLPRTACATRAKDGGIRLAVWPDFRACGDRVTQAAIAAGADPTHLMQATAAGSQDDKLSQGNPGIDLYLRKLMLVGGS